MVHKMDFPHCDKLFARIQQRFILVEHVAAYKYKHQLPIYVAGVESKIIADLKSETIELQLDEDSVASFFIFLMQVSVQRQETLAKTWEKTKNRHNETYDLDGSLRPQIKTLTLRILKDIKHASDELKIKNRTALEKIMTKNIHPDNMSEINKEQFLSLLLNIKEST